MNEVERMLRDIEWGVHYTSGMIGKRALDPRVMAAMKEVPRHEFVPPRMRECAYDDGPLSIGHGQTISQPYIVALMSDLLNPRPEHKVLEVGTGSGYQAAVLSRLVARVYSLEIIPELARAAAACLRRLGYDNVEVKSADGYLGWSGQAPFDGIIVTAAAPEVPPHLLDQLKAGGRLVIPVGSPYGPQMLQVIIKDESGGVETRDVLPVAFVPFTRAPLSGE